MVHTAISGTAWPDAAARTASAPAALIEPSASFASDFPQRPFAIRHRLAGHPLFTLPRIIELLQRMPRDHIEFNSGKVGIDQDPNEMPLLEMEPEEIIHRIETASAWMVLKRVEVDAEYRVVLDEALDAVARHRGHADRNAAGFSDIRGFLFVSSPRSTTPFHIDGEDNVFVQIHGEKLFTVYDNRDGKIASPEAVERCITRHRNLTYHDGFDVRAEPHKLLPGDGLFVPYLWPHWVGTADSYSVSLAITWKTRAVMRHNDLLLCNSLMRRLKLNPADPGRRPILDKVKASSLGLARTAVEPLRRIEALRLALRKIALGRNANYYLRAGKSKPAA